MQYGYYESAKNPVEIKESVKGYKHIVIELLATNNPHRYAKLRDIDYGITREIPDNEIDSANVLEEVGPTTDIVSINSMSFRWKTKDPVFSPIRRRYPGHFPP